MLNNEDIIKKEEIHWWDKFVLEKKDKEEFKEILEAIKIADDDTTRETVDRVIELVEELDKDKHKYDLITLERKLKIFENRLARKINDNFGYMLRSLREQRGLSLAKLGDIAGISSSYINRIELGERKAPSLPVIESLAEALNVETSVLLSAAGMNTEGKEVKSLTELVFSNNVSLTENGRMLSPEKKEEFIELIAYIDKMEWGKNKHVEMLELIDLLDEFKRD